LAHAPLPNGDRLELIMGYFHVTPPPGGPHQSLSAELWAELKAALRAGDRKDLYPVPAVGVEISTPWRTALIPDLSVLNVRPVGATFAAENLELVVEIWSPGNSQDERETKQVAYAGAGVPFFWAVDFDRRGCPTITAYRLDKGEYVLDVVAKAGERTTIKAAPVPLTLDPAHLLP
jgi:Uma2 family endonuclease